MPSSHLCALNRSAHANSRSQAQASKPEARSHTKTLNDANCWTRLVGGHARVLGAPARRANFSACFPINQSSVLDVFGSMVSASRGGTRDGGVCLRQYRASGRYHWCAHHQQGRKENLFELHPRTTLRTPFWFVRLNYNIMIICSTLSTTKTSSIEWRSLLVRFWCCWCCC